MNNANALLSARRTAVATLLDGQSQQSVCEYAEVFAPTNIALSKYWGKRDAALHLPFNSSLSVSLGEKGCRTRVAMLDAPSDHVHLNGAAVAETSSFYQKLVAFLDLIRKPGQNFRVDTHSNIPIAAGLASSACGFAALVMALSELMGWQLTKQQLSILARLGSGSASRSLWSGFVEWQRGQRDDGLDSIAQPLEVNWPELRVAVVLVDQQQKPTSSREAMQATLDTSSLYRIWPSKAEADCQAIKHAIMARDFESMAQCAENNALLMHATMHAAKPPVNYWLPASIVAMEQVWQARRDGVAVYLTMDAGPNVKLLYQAADAEAVRQLFPSLIETRPFG